MLNLWDEPSRLAALVISKLFVPADAAAIDPVLVIVAPVDEESANGVLERGAFNKAVPFPVEGTTAAFYTEVCDWQHKRTVSDTFLSGSVGTVKFPV